MELLLLSILILCAAGLVHSYLIYPRLMRLLAARTPSQPVAEFAASDWPRVSVLMAVYNEEAVIAEKLDTLLQQHYPADKIRCYIGSDCSNDATNTIVADYAARYPNLSFYAFSKRQGKPGVINALYREVIKHGPPAPDHLLLITDANVMLAPSTLRCLARHFLRPQIAIVDAHMQHTGLQADGISRSEHAYLSGEVMLKHYEGKVWGKMIGPFGGCYLLRSDHFSPIPANFLVDDFYIAMRVFEKGGHAINDLEAVGYEAVSHDWREEFRRKARISTGNYQNLVTFRHLWWPPTRPLGFAIFSHKILRWLGPFFLIGILLSTAGLYLLTHNHFYAGLLLCLIVLYFALPLADLLLRALGIHWQPSRNLRYFFLMNIALLVGFFRFIKGVNNNVWQPPKRQQRIPA